MAISPQLDFAGDFAEGLAAVRIGDDKTGKYGYVARNWKLKEGSGYLWCPDWKKKQATQAAVRCTIETVLDELPRTYSPELYQTKCDVVYQHVFDSYAGQGGGLYATM